MSATKIPQSLEDCTTTAGQTGAINTSHRETPESNSPPTTQSLGSDPFSASATTASNTLNEISQAKVTERGLWALSMIAISIGLDKTGVETFALKHSALEEEAERRHLEKLSAFRKSHHHTTAIPLHVHSKAWLEVGDDLLILPTEPSQTREQTLSNLWKRNLQERLKALDSECKMSKELFDVYDTQKRRLVEELVTVAMSAQAESTLLKQLWNERQGVTETLNSLTAGKND